VVERQYTLLAVDVEAGVVVAADDRGPYYPGPGEPYRPGTWSLLRVTSGEIVGTAETDQPHSLVATGDTAVLSTMPDCGDLTLVGGPEVTWPGEPPAVECGPVWAFDTERVLVPVRVGPDKFAATDDVRLHSVDLESGKVTELDWTGTLADTLVDRDGSELRRSWGRYLFADGAVYDTRTGEEKWRGDDVWLAGDTGVVAEELDWLDELAPGDGDRWLKVVDAATGEPARGGYITDDEVVDAYVLDRGEAVVFTTEETVLLTSE
jgi:hypothetical protein